MPFLLDETNHNGLLLPYEYQGEIQQHQAASTNEHALGHSRPCRQKTHGYQFNMQ